MTRPCCDNPNCVYCFGQGTVEVTEAQDLALEVLSMVCISDLNATECRDAIRRLCNLILHTEQ